MSYFIDYKFADRIVQNPDDSLPTTLPADVTFGAGPGTFHDLDLPKASRLGNSGPIQINVAGVEVINEELFNVSLVFGLDANFVGRQTLVESDWLPFRIELVGTQASVKLTGAVRTMDRHSWAGTDVFGSPDIAPGWHLIQLTFINDMLCLFLDGSTEGWCHGFGGGTGSIDRTLTATTVLVGGKDESSRFKGQIASLQIGFNVSFDLQTLTDPLHESAQWYMTSKVEETRGAFDLGQPTAAMTFNTTIFSWSQDYTNGRVMFHSTPNMACIIHGPLLERYKRLSATQRTALGFLADDQGGAPGNNAIKSPFKAGAIYYSPATGAFEVVGQHYVHYTAMGEGTHCGMPIEGPQTIPGGISQRFERTTMLYKTNSTAAHCIHNPIQAAYYATGGTPTWGFPLDDKFDVSGVMDGNVQRLVQVNHFEYGDFWSSQKTGAHGIKGDFKAKWDELGNVKSSLGLPTTDEVAIPGGGRATGFEHGVITWNGSFGSMQVVQPFKIFIGTINTQNSEGFGMGQNDLYLRATISDGGPIVFNQRFPASGDFGGQDILTFNSELDSALVPNPTRDITLVLDIWESDDGAPFGEGDDHIGTWTKTLNSGNAWGLSENGGILSSGGISMINNITAAIHPLVDVNTLTETNKFWGGNAWNRGTDPIDYQTYGEAFTDVDPNPQAWDVLDYVDKGFYEAVAKHIAKNGNCFGMSLEAIYSRKNASLFSMPIDRFNDWNTLQHTFNVKHQYQVGATAIWWFVSEFLSGHTHSPVRVFNETRTAFAVNNNAVLCISQNADFSGAPHCLFPVAWNDTTSPWQITVHDPNFPAELRTLTIDSTTNIWRYEGSKTYSGSEWSGGRMYYIPWSILCSRPRTPVWDVVMLLLAGTVMILGSGTTTASITALNGADLTAHGPRAIRDLQAGRTLDGYFVKAPMLAADGSDGAGELTFSQAGPPRIAATPINPTNTVTTGVTGGLAGRPTIDALLARAPAIRLEPHLSLTHLEARLATIQPTTDFQHTFRGREGGGTHSQLVKSGNTILGVTAPMASGETGHLEVKSLGTSNSLLTIAHSKPKIHTVVLHQRKGLGRDTIAMSFRLTTTAAGSIKLAPKPGLARLDLESTAAKVSAAALEITKVKAGVVTTHAFDLIRQGDAVLEGRLQLRLPTGKALDKIAARSMDPAGTARILGSRVIEGRVLGGGGPLIGGPLVGHFGDIIRGLGDIHIEHGPSP